MSLLGGGSLIYTPPVPALARYEPTGTWMAIAENYVAFSRDGINWLAAEWAPSSFWDAIDMWEYAGPGPRMVIAGSDIGSFTWRMTSINPVTFTQSTSGPNPGANDEFDAAVRLSHGTGGFIGTTNSQIRSSSDADNWLEELPVPGNFANAGMGEQQWRPEVSLHIRLGSGEFPTTPGSYWTSGNGTGWTERTFPEAFGSGIFQNQARMAGNGTDVVVVGMHNGRIYRTLDGVTWSLRHDPFPETSIGSIVWNPMANNGAGAFFAVQGATNPDNLLTSADGIFWNPVDPNDLPTGLQLAADTGKNLMIARSGGFGGGSSTPDFQIGGCFQSDDDGETWAEFGDKAGGWVGFIPAKIGPVVVETLNIDTGAIVIAESRTDPDVSKTSLLLTGFSDLEGNSVRKSTIVAGESSLGKWANTLDELNPYYHECRLDRTSGDDFNFGTSAINAWIDFSANWGYLLNAGVDVKTFTGTLRVRHKETLVESNSVSVQMDCEVTA